MKTASLNVLIALVALMLHVAEARGAPQQFIFDDSQEGAITLRAISPTGTITSIIFPETAAIVFTYNDNVPAAANIVTYINFTEPAGQGAGDPDGATMISDTFEHILRVGSSVEEVCFSSDPVAACAIPNPPVAPVPANMAETGSEQLVRTVISVTAGEVEVLTTYTVISDVVPEPGTLLLVVPGLLGLVAAVWRHQRQS